MAKLNANRMLCNVAVNDNVVAGRMGIGMDLANRQHSATLSQGWPALAGPEPTPALREVCALVDSDYRDATCERAGRSAVCPTAGGLVLPRLRPAHARTAIAMRWSRFDAKQMSKRPLVTKQCFAVSGTRQTSAR